MRTLVEHVAQRTIVQNHDLAEVGFDRAQILDKGTVTECTMLPIKPPREELSFLLEPVDHRIGILLH